MIVTAMLLFVMTGLLIALAPLSLQARAQGTSTKNAACRVEPTDYRGWKAQQISNRWMQLIVVPQNGGRLMQVTFSGHPYLFVNPKLAGRYQPPTPGQWFNYGGDKMWLLPEGTEDEQHWAGDSDVLDDGPFSFRKVSEGEHCEIELTGPADPQTGIQFVRTIRLDSDSPRIRFHTDMKNITGHTLEWSMQSVSQYDTAGAGASTSAPGSSAAPFNHDFWTFTPTNPSSAYLNRYHVRFGPAENPAASVRDDGLFTVHYAHMAAELWIDSTDGWLAVVDGSSRYAMVERFQYEASKSYPGKASVIFWTNGPETRLSSDGVPSLNADGDGVPYYLEAEAQQSALPVAARGELQPSIQNGFPTRAGSEFHGATDAGIMIQPLRATDSQNGKIRLSGAFGVFFSGRLVAHFYDQHGRSLGTSPVTDVSPSDPVSLEMEVAATGKPARVSLHLEDENGLDRGALQEIQVASGDKR